MAVFVLGVYLQTLSDYQTLGRYRGHGPWPCCAPRTSTRKDAGESQLVVIPCGCMSPAFPGRSFSSVEMLRWASESKAPQGSWSEADQHLLGHLVLDERDHLGFENSSQQALGSLALAVLELHQAGIKVGLGFLTPFRGSGE